MQPLLTILPCSTPPPLPAECAELFSAEMTSKDLSDLQADVREIKTHLGWHRKFMILLGTGILFLFAWIFIKLPGQERTNTANLVSPLVHRLAAVQAKLDLSQMNAPSELPQLMRSALQDADKAIGTERLGALAELAKQKRIVADDADVRRVGNRVIIKYQCDSKFEGLERSSSTRELYFELDQATCISG